MNNDKRIVCQLNTLLADQIIKGGKDEFCRKDVSSLLVQYQKFSYSISPLAMIELDGNAQTNNHHHGRCHSLIP